MDELVAYLEGVLEHRKGEPLWGAAKIGPEYWADAPWRLDPDQILIPLCFIARDAIGKVVTQIDVYGPGGIEPLHSFAGPGEIEQRYWFYAPTPTIPRPPGYTPDPSWPTSGKRLRLRVQFIDQQQNPPRVVYAQQLEIFVASQPLPLGRSAEWAYGDTHHHSLYTNDLKEFGNPIADTRLAARSLGLNWLILTDHSVDLSSSNPYWSNSKPDSRWQALGDEVTSTNQADAAFCLIRGEEVTVKGVRGAGLPGLIGDDTLHLLVFGRQFEHMIPGAFLETAWLKKAAKISDKVLGSKIILRNLFGKIYPLGAVLTGRDSANKVVAALKERHVAKQNLLAFAAHPSTDAQGLYGTWEQADLMQGIHGMEAWNTRVRRRAGNEENPFDEAGWISSNSVPFEQKEDAAIRQWDNLLQQRVGLAQPRFVLLAGSDSHGSFNYDVYWGGSLNLLAVSDNSLGRVRTLLYLPDRAGAAHQTAPSQAEIIAALQHGRCVVTDGPVITFTAAFGAQIARLGDILEGLSGDGTLDVCVQTASSPEFGAVKAFSVRWYFQGMDAAQQQVLMLDGTDEWTFALDTGVGSGYLRLETVTESQGQRYRCVTNPIWLRFEAAGQRTLRITHMD